jgi:gamma-glutamyl-gamma-aminobutyrate hydrolase PuuD
MSRKIYVVGGDYSYANWMQPTSIVKSIKDADLVVFTGGEDVTPAIYGEPAHPKSYYNVQRDFAERIEFESAHGMGKKIVGICRGAQFLCVMAGGKLVQDQEVQPRYHDMQTIDGKTIKVTSTHHQAQWPYNLTLGDYEILGFTDHLSGWHEDGQEKEIVLGNAGIMQYGENRSGDNLLEVEVCYYPKIQALGIQPHPEYYYGSKDPELKESISYFQDLLNKHMGGKL